MDAESLSVGESGESASAVADGLDAEPGLPARFIGDGDVAAERISEAGALVWQRRKWSSDGEGLRRADSPASPSSPVPISCCYPHMLSSRALSLLGRTVLTIDLRRTSLESGS